MERFKYLGNISQIKSRIEMIRATFNKMRPFFCDDNSHVKLRQQITDINMYFYDSETLKVKTINRLEAFEM